MQCNFKRYIHAWSKPPRVEPTLSILELRALRTLACIDPVQDPDAVLRLGLLSQLPELEDLHICLELVYEVSAMRKRRTNLD